MLLRVLLAAALVIAAVADEQSEGILGECITKCFNDLEEFPALINFMGTTPANQFLNIEGMCSKKVDLSACVGKCGASESQFHSEYLDVVCNPAQLAEIKMHETCLNGQGDVIKQLCDTQCAGSIEDMQEKHQLNASEVLTDDSFCKLKKCHLRCFLETVAKSCHSSDADIGHFTKRWLKSTVQAIGNDIAKASPNTADQLCDFFSDSNIILSEEIQYGSEFSSKASVQRSNSLLLFPIIVGFILAHLFHQ
uniref:Uncharacterized protein n=1 Tax=Plectus sambesii TaxID=2011161 RepID=A0A914W401_9BILA